MLFSFALALITGVVFGVAPAWIASHADPADALRGAGRSTTHGASLPQKISGGGTGRPVARTGGGSGAHGPEPAQTRTPELWISKRPALYRPCGPRLRGPVAREAGGQLPRACSKKCAAIPGVDHRQLFHVQPTWRRQVGAPPSTCSVERICRAKTAITRRGSASGQTTLRRLEHGCCGDEPSANRTRRLRRGSPSSMSGLPRSSSRTKTPSASISVATIPNTRLTSRSSA